jgi:hypothetical protein
MITTARPTLKPRRRDRLGKHIDHSADLYIADYANKPRRSAGWVPKHRVDA